MVYQLFLTLIHLVTPSQLQAFILVSISATHTEEINRNSSHNHLSPANSLPGLIYPKLADSNGLLLVYACG